MIDSSPACFISTNDGRRKTQKDKRKEAKEGIGETRTRKRCVRME